ncbi:MAG: membrane protein insertion efficiency factor YidD [Bdellovibrionales bacterium]
MQFCLRAWQKSHKIFAAIIRTLALSLIYFYQSFLRGFLGGTCRFSPTCSQYAVEAYQTHPPLKATSLAIKRICRCHPLGPFGWDPVPSALKENAQP